MHSARLLVRSLGVLALAALIGAAVVHHSDAGAQAPVVQTFAPGLPTSNFDPTCKPCDDFYQFATGGFVKVHPRPAQFPVWDTFGILSQSNREVLHGILEAAAKDAAAPPGSNEQKIGTSYRSCMDEAGVEAAGLAPLQPQLDAIAGITDLAGLAAVAAQLQRIGVNTAWEIDSGPDERDSSKTIAQLDTARLGLPDRDYYLNEDERSKTIRDKYVAYVATLLGLDGIDQAAATAAGQNILAFETGLAKATPTRAELRDPMRTYHPEALAAVQQLAPAIDWKAYAASVGAPPFATVNVELPAYVAALQTALTTVPLATWKQYLTFKVIDTYAPTLPTRFYDASFAFHSGVMFGVTVQQARYLRCVRSVDNALGEALGAVYVAKAFPPQAKARAQALVANLQRELHDDIATLDWMSPPTRRQAEIKLAAYVKKIGYPDRFRDYSALTVVDGPYAANALAAQRFESAYELAKIGKPTDRTEWGLSPPTVNAYYSIENNEIVFPAGILQPPFFSPRNDDALNYGGIGAVIGHEMTHGFDDQGRLFDERGNLHNWWTPGDAARFAAHAQCIVDEFNGFQLDPGIHENGKLVEGEAIADLGGITLAFKAFQKTAEYKAHRPIDGYTPEQRFFLAFAQVWAGTRTDAYARQMVTVDPHPDNRFRVIGTLSNLPPFRAAFSCAAHDTMVRAHVCKIW
jgi:putative endopeptidase